LIFRLKKSQIKKVRNKLYIPEAETVGSLIIFSAFSSIGGSPTPGSGDTLRTVSGLGSGDVLETPSTVTIIFLSHMELYTLRVPMWKRLN